MDSILKELHLTRQAARKLIQLSNEDINAILNRLADETVRETARLLAANQLDLERMDPADPKYDRLLLNPQRLEDIAQDIRKVAQLPSPLGRILEGRTLPNGLELKKISVPMGVIGIVYESRPNVTFDVFALCLKSGNAAVLKGSRDAHFSNLAIVDLIKNILTDYGLTQIVYLAPSEREALLPILTANAYIDLVIPRGSQGLIDFVRKNATVPVIETGAGIVHTYFDASGDLAKGSAIVNNAKTRRVSVCNALDTLIVHAARLNDLADLLAPLAEHQVELFADEMSLAQLQGKYPAELLALAEAQHFGTEFLSYKMSVKTVANLQEALDHIDRYSSRHSETIVAEDLAVQEQFLRNVDAAVVYANASTAFTDGSQFGMGAEIGISTQKLHARGPMALPELTSYKWVVKGTGQIRA
ncbi:glutamate-5-semialdehyde dehydrogenase [Haliscomenobacter hydrossis]|uniref:Gamma-glutamyl phosphate reductase n=1 Tax=Haliscomenobacter hydrossis (strain ATCC 27775 / DSM 1100 / LMG 10767 / O) TaxID=760192 RepID=F4L591_HALH1|nr:glutamate-5-semialdehyde dehydrogenase [Haliscomenobacter hydrossis]AEE49771.1 Gamma-glutamyl phosphate reductase [Haliscomenobacter hydrossis DSM 1100]